MRRFGVSTRLFGDERLRRDHLTAIAEHGFETVELFATGSHFDCRDPAAVQTLASWLRDAGLEMTSVQAAVDRSTASQNTTVWHDTLAEINAALDLARHIPFSHLVVHLGVPAPQLRDADDNSRGAAVRTIEEICRIAEPLGVTPALEVMDNKLASVDGLLDLIENDLDGMPIGICMDVGHAFLLGDTAEAIESAGGYLVTTHLHDNRRQRDDHLVPFQGAIDWPGTIMEFEKIGYDGVFMFEVKSGQSAAATLDQLARARRRLDALAASSVLEADTWTS